MNMPVNIKKSSKWQLTSFQVRLMVKRGTSEKTERVQTNKQTNKQKTIKTVHITSVCREQDQEIIN